MATQTILSKFGTATAMTCTLASLASSAVGVGRQTTLLDNSATKHSRVHIYILITSNGTTNVTANTNVFFYLIKSDGTYVTDGAGARDAG